MNIYETDVKKDARAYFDDNEQPRDFDLEDLGAVIEISSRRIEHALMNLANAVERSNAIAMCADGETPSHTAMAFYKDFDYDKGKLGR